MRITKQAQAILDILTRNAEQEQSMVPIYAESKHLKKWAKVKQGEASEAAYILRLIREYLGLEDKS
jgi:hypothetical protein